MPKNTAIPKGGGATRESKPLVIPHAPSHYEIAVLARALWVERGCPEGSPEDDWFRAEQRLQLEKRRAAGR
jgi:hypothetical protein